MLQVEPPIILHTRSTKNTPAQPAQPAVLFVEQALTDEERQQVLENLGLTDVLRYSAQILASAQQKQARDNIGYQEPRNGKDGKDGVDGKDGEKGDKGEDGSSMSTDQFAAKMAEVLGLAAAVGGAAGTVLGLVGKGVGDLFSKLFGGSGSGGTGTGGSPTDDSTARRDELLRGCVRYDKAQDLPDAQKGRARDNIGAGTGGDFVTRGEARATYVAFDRPTNLDESQARTARASIRVREDFVSFRETQELDEEDAARARENLRVQDQLISYLAPQDLTAEQRALVRHTLHIANNRTVLPLGAEEAPARRPRPVAGPQGQRGPPGRGSLIIYQNDWHLSQKSVHVTRTEHHRQLLQSSTSMAIDVGRLRALETRLRQLELLVSDIDANRPVATE